MPLLKPGETAHGLQLWLNLKEKDKMCEVSPFCLHVPAVEAQWVDLLAQQLLTLFVLLMSRDHPLTAALPGASSGKSTEGRERRHQGIRHRW